MRHGCPYLFSLVEALKGPLNLAVLHTTLPGGRVETIALLPLLGVPWCQTRAVAYVHNSVFCNWCAMLLGGDREQ